VWQNRSEQLLTTGYEAKEGSTALSLSTANSNTLYQISSLNQLWITL